MKFKLTRISLLIVLFSCNSAPEKIEAGKEKELIRRFSPILHGVWVQADYMDDIVKTKSPSRSRNKLKFITQFTIDTSRISADSVDIEAALGNHEGRKLYTLFQKGENADIVANVLSRFWKYG